MRALSTILYTLVPARYYIKSACNAIEALEFRPHWVNGSTRAWSVTTPLRHGLWFIVAILPAGAPLHTICFNTKSSCKSVCTFFGLWLLLYPQVALTSILRPKLNICLLFLYSLRNMSGNHKVVNVCKINFYTCLIRVLNILYKLYFGSLAIRMDISL